MVLYDKSALTKKLGRRLAKQIDVLLTPESDELAVRAALDRLMRLDTEKIALTYGSEPPEILVAAAVGFLRLKGGDNSEAGIVAVDNFNEAIRLDPELDNDTLFRQDFIYELIKAGADQGDRALGAVISDLYTGDIVAPGANARAAADGITETKLREAIAAQLADNAQDPDAEKRTAATGISLVQLLDELDWKPYDRNGFARSRNYMQEGRKARADGDNTRAAELFFKAAALWNVEAAMAYAHLTTALFGGTNDAALPDGANNAALPGGTSDAVLFDGTSDAAPTGETNDAPRAAEPLTDAALSAPAVPAAPATLAVPTAPFADGLSTCNLNLKAAGKLKKTQIKAAGKFAKARQKLSRLAEAGTGAEGLAAALDTRDLRQHPSALFARGVLLAKSEDADVAAESLRLITEAAERGEPEAERYLAEYYSDPASFDFAGMMRYLLLGLVNPGNWYVFGSRPDETFTARAEANNEAAFELSAALLEKFCYCRDMIDELEELSEPLALDIPELSEAERETVFMRFLCDPLSDASREVLARLYSAGFGVEADRDKAVDLWRELCLKYAPEAFVPGSGDNDSTVATDSAPDAAVSAKTALDAADSAKTANDTNAVEPAATAVDPAAAAVDTAPTAAEPSATAAEPTATAAEPAANAAPAVADAGSAPADVTNTAETDAASETPATETVAAAGNNEAAGSDAANAADTQADAPAPETAANTSANTADTSENTAADTAAKPAPTLYATVGSDSEAESNYRPYEAYYEYALHLITAEGEARDVDSGRRLLALIPKDSGFHAKAEKLLALSETQTSELLRLGALFHKEGNDDAMIKLYSAAERLGDPAACRILGRYYALSDMIGGRGKAMEHYLLGASRGDVPSMYMAGSAYQATGDNDDALRYLTLAADAGERSDDREVQGIAARAMRDVADMYYSGAANGEKDVPQYLYWLDRSEALGFKLTDAQVDKRRAAENYFKPAQWQETFKNAMSGPDCGYKDWVIRTCAERKITAAQEELGVRLYQDRMTGFRTADGQKVAGAYSALRTPSLGSPRAQYYTALCLYAGKGCERNPLLAAEMLPAPELFGDPERMRNEIEGVAACVEADNQRRKHPEKASELLKKAEPALTRALENDGRESVRYLLADILIRAFDVPDEFDGTRLLALKRRGYGYLMDGYGKDPRCTERIDDLSVDRICEIAGLFEGDKALAWYLLAAGDNVKAQYGAGKLYLERIRKAESTRKPDADDVNNARYYLKLAADAGIADAELAMYTERKLFGTPSEEARLYLKRSAVHGSETAGKLCKELEIAY